MKAIVWFPGQPSRAPLTFISLIFVTFLFATCPSARAADTTRPTISITFPAPGAVVTNGNITVAGHAHDNVGVAFVSYSVNGSGFTTANSVDNWTNWSANVGLTPGTNVVLAFAADSSGNFSDTNRVTIFFQEKAAPTVSKVGQGTITPNYNNVPLIVSHAYAMTATAAPGSRFISWTGSTSTTNPTVVFVMEPGVNLTANFQDIQRPTVTIARPIPGQVVTSNSFTIAGTASDNVAVANVSFSVNGSGFATANTANNWTNWAANVGLNPGTNTVRVFATDTSGNVSPTNGVAFFFVLKAPLTVTMSGGRGVPSIPSGTLLNVGQSYVITIIPNPGFKFNGWSGGVSSTNPTVRFTMEQGLVLTANFTDIARPTVAITSPIQGQITANPNFIVMGTASDNLAVASVSFQLNGGGWNTAQTLNNWRTWMAQVTLKQGANVIQAFSMDTTGHFSPTNAVGMFFTPTRATAPLSIQGTLAQFTPDNDSPFQTFFGAGTCSEFMTGSTDFSGVGTYAYKRLTTNTATLKFGFFLPPTSVTTTDTLNLTFSSDESARYTDINTGFTGSVAFFQTTSLAPLTLQNTTVHATSSADALTLLTLGTNTFTQKDSDGTASSGNFTYQKFSPRSGMLILAYTDAAMNGSTNYVQLMFEAAGSGGYLVTSFDPNGVLSGSISGTFTTP